ncbi:hypothetical protein BV22DRAFT_861346 [Leucogyrophana mollusca]|uniref:Uncharacterized protein n=1 Tax=Leucogyrophana mollusca TaxID=85980 RepID=A0ACB8B167_9AGAM|nr:hypothetical protein BV22DRAFT_861346 [Leucogyrophana mollusca]
MADGFTGVTGELEGHLTMFVRPRPWAIRWCRLFSRFSAALIVTVTYGHKVTIRDGLLVGRIQEIAGVLAIELTPERATMFAVPTLQYLPAWFPATRTPSIASWGA